MSLRTKLGMESKGMIASFVFNTTVGVVFLALLPIVGLLPHIAIIGIFSLIAAYGIFKKRNWTIWPTVILFFAAATFSAYMSYTYLTIGDYILSPIMIVYFILTCAFTAYQVSKRKTLET